MLSPDDRSLLADLLAPPPGYTLEHAVATTFTLDLIALLAIPLGFTGSDLVADANPLAVLQAVRQNADRIDVFAQMGMVKVPDKPNSLLEFLGEVIHQVRAPRKGFLFHPKLWVLRYSPVDDMENDPHRFRLICGSRNLTFDRSWDAAVVLNGTECGQRVAVNNPLGAFLRSLPGRAGGLTGDRRKRMNETVQRLSRVKWERPDGVADVKKWLKFHVFGQAATPRPDTTGSKTLIVSPFLNSEGIRLFEDCGPLHVVSRSEQFDMLDQEDREWISDPIQSLYSLNDSASIHDLEDEEAGVRWELTGLHAKIYAFDRGHYTHVLVGSTNATGAGWSGNDEFMVEIVGKRREFGIDTLIDKDSPFRKLLIEHTFGDVVKTDTDDDLRRRLENDLRNIASLGFAGAIHGTEDEGWSETLRTKSKVRTSVENVDVTIGLITRPTDRRSVALDHPIQADWRLDGIHETTPFVVIELTSGRVKVSSVLLVQLDGGPADRVDRILARQFSTPEAFLQFVAMLLALANGDGSVDIEMILGHEGVATGDWILGRSGLLESLLKALSRSPRSIDDLARLVERLRGTTEGQQALPEGWDELWDAVLDAHNVLEARP